MADDAFALSPISARAARPGEADYQAIREAFMETARGRWFLGEYAKRNRNADTRLVLDQVARIERMLDTMPQQPSDGRLAEILASIRSVVDQAAEVAGSAAIGLEIDERLTPIRQGARILKEISWRWREIGTDARICDLIDAQLDAIQESCRQLAKVDTRTALAAAFELMRTRIDALAEENGLAPLKPSADAAADLHGLAAAAPTRNDETLASLATLAGTMTPADAVVSIQEVDAVAVADEAVQTADVWRNGEQALFGVPASSDPAAVIRRMSLTDKMTFFG
ncbi:hypothetical protein [Bradyrhizobium sp.]|uniref:hypothetical protein n=1 Tax=Bradyrhizobium sp. TaxID=376 RepID=UPI001EBB3C88|nr:hypothetical protein [Bradyrhizobium sp.]MBV8919952.1 hypothetical protein [Bradyrhizobium sp.]MBV9982543.1 hypothetical protein [Bradyrhizobium sp.]